MSTLNRNRNYWIAAGSMVVGSLLIFGSVVLMNELSSGIDNKQVETTTSFEIVKQNKPEPEKIIQRQQPEPEPDKVRPPSPLAGLDTSLAGIELDLPAFNMGLLNALQGGVLGDPRDVVMTGESVDVPPRPAYRAPMAYPVTAKAQGVEGYVLLSVLISASGDVEQVKVLESSPDGVFEQVAVNGVADWRFEPAKYQGKQVRVWAKQKIRFDLS